MSYEIRARGPFPKIDPLMLEDYAYLKGSLNKDEEMYAFTYDSRGLSEAIRFYLNDYYNMVLFTGVDLYGSGDQALRVIRELKACIQTRSDNKELLINVGGGESLDGKIYMIVAYGKIKKEWHPEIRVALQDALEDSLLERPNHQKIGLMCLVDIIEDSLPPHGPNVH